jgi:uncharacterized membrane protein YgcG
MIRHPYGPDELDRRDPVLDGIAEQLQAFASGQRSGPPVDLAARIHAAVDAAPSSAVGRWARFTGPLAPWATPARGFAAVLVVAAAVVAALVVGDIADLIRGPVSPGTTPSPSVVVSPSPSPTLSPSPSPLPSPSPSASPSDSPRPATPAPSATDDEGEIETPEPSESDSSGPGGGDNSGSGGGGGDGGDNSGPGGGGG